MIWIILIAGWGCVSIGFIFGAIWGRAIAANETMHWYQRWVDAQYQITNLKRNWENRPGS